MAKLENPRTRIIDEQSGFREPLVSVVIPTYNRPDGLSNAIRSVLAQTYKNVEVFVVDDCSQCDNQSVVNSLPSRINYRRMEANRGANFCRNVGAKLGSGKYVAFLDDDDVWHENKIESQVVACEQMNAELCYTGKNIVIVGANGEGRRERYSFSEPPFVCYKRSIMARNFIGTTSSILVSRRSFLQVGGFDEKMPALQDYDFYIDYIFSGFSVLGIDKPLVDYMVITGSGSISKSYLKYQRANARLLLKNRRRKFFSIFCFGRLISSVKRALKLVLRA